VEYHMPNILKMTIISQIHQIT